jgi:hypothetical protein
LAAARFTARNRVRAVRRAAVRRARAAKVRRAGEVRERTAARPRRFRRTVGFFAVLVATKANLRTQTSADKHAARRPAPERGGSALASRLTSSLANTSAISQPQA